MKKLTVKRAIQIQATAAEVWEFIVSPSAMKRWMLVEPVVDESVPLALGSRVVWADDTGKPYLTGTVTMFVPGKRLVLDLSDVSWRRQAKAGEVTYALALEEANKGTRVTFSLDDLSIDPEAQMWYDAYAKSRELEAIKEMAENPRR